MHSSVVVLIIIFEGARSVSLYANQGQAWRQLTQFVDRRWEQRFGRTPLPIEPQERAERFFRNESNDLFAILDADISELRDALT